jgi:23S rRNA (uracil1939-C5)-methyltransferase
LKNRNKPNHKRSASEQKILDVTIEKIVANGFGFAFAEGLTIFVSLAVKGDKLRVRITKQKGTVAFAEIVEIIEPSPMRVIPECQYFGRCGGCDFQQMSYKEQLNSKVAILKDCLKRIGRIEFENEIPIYGSPKEFGYRTRTCIHADARSKKVGFFRRNTNEVFDVDKCIVLSEEVQAALTETRNSIEFEKLSANIADIELAGGEDGSSMYCDEILEETREISLVFGDFTYYFNAKTFFQSNSSLIPKLIDAATCNIQGELALELFCGVGLFSLPLANHFKKLVAVEDNEIAIEFAEKNADIAKIENIEFEAEDVGDYLLGNEFGKVDFVLLDPPRTGIEKDALLRIIEIKPALITYVSCDPATLARDLKIVTENGYEIVSIEAFDLFPQTHHVETVAKMKLLAE